jgi:hypothetical protein
MYNLQLDFDDIVTQPYPSHSWVVSVSDYSDKKTRLFEVAITCGGWTYEGLANWDQGEIEIFGEAWTAIEHAIDRDKIMATIKTLAPKARI